MLENIRNIAHNKLFKVFFFFLAIIFAVSLGNFDNSRDKENIVAMVGKEKITLNEFRRARNIEIQNLNSMQNLPLEQVQMFADQINNMTLNKLITQSLLKQELKVLEINIPHEVVAEYVHSDPTFHNNGNFDPTLYKELLKQNNLNEETFLDSIAQQTAGRYLLESIVSNVPLKNVITSYIKNFLLEKRDVILVTVDSSKFDVGKQPEEKLIEFYKNHPNFFQSNELRNFELVLFDKNNVKSNTKITDDMLLKEYQERKEEYALPEKRDLYHFLTPNENIAKEIEEALKNDSDHIKIAKNFVDKKVISEAFSNQTRESFLSTINKAIFNAKESEILTAVKSELGWHVFKITKIHPVNYQDFVKVKEKVKENLEQKLLKQQLYELAREVEDELASGSELAEIAIKFNLEYKKLENIANDDSKLTLNPEIVVSAFELNENEDSGIKILDDSMKVYIVKLKKITSPSLIPYEKIKDRVKDFYLADLKQSITSIIANNIYLEGNKDQQKLFQLNNLSFNTSALDYLIKKVLLEKQLPTVSSYIRCRVG